MLKDQGHEYTASPSKEDHDEPLLTSNATPSSSNNEDGWPRRQSWSMRRSASVADNMPYWALIIVGMLAVIIGLQLTLWYEMRTQSCKSLLQVGGDFNQKEPTSSSSSANQPWATSLTQSAVGTEILKWNPDAEFTPLNATEFLRPEVAKKWETLYPGQ